MAQYYRFESIQFETNDVPLGKINFEEFKQAKIMIEDGITLDTKESSIEWFPEKPEYEEQLYWIYSYRHIYTLIDNTIKKLLISKLFQSIMINQTDFSNFKVNTVR